MLIYSHLVHLYWFCNKISLILECRRIPGSQETLIPLAFQPCVIIPLEKNNGVAGDNPTPLNRLKSSQSFITHGDPPEIETAAGRATAGQVVPIAIRMLYERSLGMWLSYAKTVSRSVYPKKWKRKKVKQNSSLINPCHLFLV